MHYGRTAGTLPIDARQEAWLADLQTWLRNRDRPLRLGLYIHVPFCVDRCTYCDFVTVRYRAEWRRPYLDALVRELAFWRAILGPATVVTVYFGGGTPSLLRPSEVATLVAHIAEVWNLEPHAEITLEATPRTLPAKRIDAFLAAGVNRISVGLQTLDDPMLRWLDRQHTAQDAHAVGRALACSGVVWNADFLIGVPGPLDRINEEILRFVDRYQPHHISLYALEIHPETPLGRAVHSGMVALPGQRQVQKQWLSLQRNLEQRGYRFYELANAARPGFASRHNRIYWRLQPYLGLGVAAHSCIGPWRWANPVRWFQYRDVALSGRQVEVRTLHERQRERILLGLRMRRGIPVIWLDRYHWGDAWRHGLALAQHLGWVRRRGQRLQVTPRGWVRLMRVYDLLGLAREAEPV